MRDRGGVGHGWGKERFELRQSPVGQGRQPGIRHSAELGARAFCLLPFLGGATPGFEPSVFLTKLWGLYLMDRTSGIVSTDCPKFSSWLHLAL